MALAVRSNLDLLAHADNIDRSQDQYPIRTGAEFFGLL